MTVAVHGLVLRAARRRLLPGSGVGGVVGLCYSRVVIAQIPRFAPAGQVRVVLLLGPGLVHQAVGIGVIGGIVVVTNLGFPICHVSW